MEWRQLNYFLRACDYASIAAAAEHIGTVQSNVSMQISQLEHELGVKLCKRDSAGFLPTQAGERFYLVAQRLIAEMEFASRRVRSALTDESMQIALAASMAPRGSVMAETLREVVRLIGKRYPYINLRLIDFLAGVVTSNDEIGAVVEARADCEFFDALEVRDRWAFVTRRGETNLPEGRLSLADISGFATSLRIGVPKMPLALAALGEEFAKSAGMVLTQEDLGIAELEKGYFNSSNAVLLPFSCMPGFSKQQRFQISYAEPHSSDPTWRIERAGNAEGRIVQAMAETFCDVLRQHLPPSAKVGGSNRWRSVRDEPDEGEPLSFREVRTFDVAFERGNISRAATELGVSQPAVSNTLRKLERTVGEKLFVRTAHGIVPTERGMLLRRLSQPVLQDFAEARRQFRELGRKKPAPIRVGILPVLDDDSLLAVTIADAVSEWSRLATGHELKLTEGFNARLRRWTVQEMLDFAIVDTEARQSGLVVTLLSRDSMAVVTNPRFAVLPPGPVKAADVLGLNLVLPSERHGLRNIIQRAFGEAGMTIIPRLEIDSMAMTLNLVKTGDWATVLPVSAIYKRAHAKELQINVITEPAIDRCLSLIRRTGSKPSANAALFIEILTGHVREFDRSIADLS